MLPRSGAMYNGTCCNICILNGYTSKSHFWGSTLSGNPCCGACNYRSMWKTSRRRTGCLGLISSPEVEWGSKMYQISKIANFRLYVKFMLNNFFFLVSVNIQGKGVKKRWFSPQRPWTCNSSWLCENKILRDSAIESEGEKGNSSKKLSYSSKWTWHVLSWT